MTDFVWFDGTDVRQGAAGTIVDPSKIFWADGVDSPSDQTYFALRSDGNVVATYFSVIPSAINGHVFDDYGVATIVPVDDFELDSTDNTAYRPDTSQTIPYPSGTTPQFYDGSNLWAQDDNTGEISVLDFTGAVVLSLPNATLVPLVGGSSELTLALTNTLEIPAGSGVLISQVTAVFEAGTLLFVPLDQPIIDGKSANDMNTLLSSVGYGGELMPSYKRLYIDDTPE